MKTHLFLLAVGKTAVRARCGLLVEPKQAVSKEEDTTCKRCVPAPGHRPRFSRRKRGYTPTYPARTVYGYTIYCSCGWEHRTNGTLREAKSDYVSHIREVKK